MDKILALRAQVQSLRDGRFNFLAAEIVVDNLKAMIQGNETTWYSLGTNSEELDGILARLKRKFIAEEKN